MYELQENHIQRLSNLILNHYKTPQFTLPLSQNETLGIFKAVLGSDAEDLTYKEINSYYRYIQNRLITTGKLKTTQNKNMFKTA
jgi:hypothetical protein